VSPGSHAVALVTAVRGELEAGGGARESAAAALLVLRDVPPEDLRHVAATLAAIAASLLPEDPEDAATILRTLGLAFPE
jgi:hypothetical protein